MGYFSGERFGTGERYSGAQNTRSKRPLIVAIARFGVLITRCWTTPRRVYDRCRSAGQPSPVTTRRWSASVVRSQQPRCTVSIPSDDPCTDGGGGGDAIGSCMYGEAPTIAAITRNDNIIDSASTKKILVKKKKTTTTASDLHIIN